jgi:isopentenyl diphosphate isomerase/L-lactate dehydrogenase-like FMN-dependent dehydrogenase
MPWRPLVRLALKGHLENLRSEIERDMKLMGCRTVDQLSRDNLKFR